MLQRTILTKKEKIKQCNLNVWFLPSNIIQMPQMFQFIAYIELVNLINKLAAQTNIILQLISVGKTHQDINVPWILQTDKKKNNQKCYIKSGHCSLPKL